MVSGAAPMHRLHLLRHAKSDRDGTLEDHERPLSRRGRDAARRVGESLPAALGAIDLVLCSTSLRTRETAERVLARFAPKPAIRFEEALYLAGRAALMRRLSQLDESAGAVIVIGHNPGLHELALALAASDSPRYGALTAGRFPTTARASFAIARPWASIAGSRHQLTDYVTAKSLGD
jgi:phosphohistidine phosphatase